MAQASSRAVLLAEQERVRKKTLRPGHTRFPTRQPSDTADSTAKSVANTQEPSGNLKLILNLPTEDVAYFSENYPLFAAIYKDAHQEQPVSKARLDALADQLEGKTQPSTPPTTIGTELTHNSDTAQKALSDLIDAIDAKACDEDLEAAAFNAVDALAAIRSKSPDTIKDILRETIQDEAIAEVIAAAIAERLQEHPKISKVRAAQQHEANELQENANSEKEEIEREKTDISTLIQSKTKTSDVLKSTWTSIFKQKEITTLDAQISTLTGKLAERSSTLKGVLVRQTDDKNSLKANHQKEIQEHQTTQEALEHIEQTVTELKTTLEAQAKAEAPIAAVNGIPNTANPAPTHTLDPSRQTAANSPRRPKRSKLNRWARRQIDRHPVRTIFAAAVTGIAITISTFIMGADKTSATQHFTAAAQAQSVEPETPAPTVAEAVIAATALEPTGKNGRGRTTGGKRSETNWDTDENTHFAEEALKDAGTTPDFTSTDQHPLPAPGLD